MRPPEEGCSLAPSNCSHVLPAPWGRWAQLTAQSGSRGADDAPGPAAPQHAELGTRGEGAGGLLPPRGPQVPQGLWGWRGAGEQPGGLRRPERQQGDGCSSPTATGMA